MEQKKQNDQGPVLDHYGHCEKCKVDLVASAEELLDMGDKILGGCPQCEAVLEFVKGEEHGKD